MSSELDIDTLLVHAGEPQIDGSVAMPVFQSSTYAYPPGGAETYDDIRYLRLNNSPNHLALHQKLAAIDGADAALVTASGMSAIAATLMTVASPGDHVLVQRGIYGGTFAFIREQFERQRIEWTLVAPDDPDTWESARRDGTVALYLETFANPTLEAADLPAAARFCARHEIVSVVDNTFATPINVRPIAHGIDLVVQSATKYLNGHSDVVAGAVTGSRERIDAIRHQLNQWGGPLDPHACVLLQRGMKTLGLRVRHQNATALALARSLEAHPSVRRVNYPLLESHPNFDYVRRSCVGAGGVLSFELADPSRVAAVISALQLATRAPSLGGTETLVDIPAQASHVSLTARERKDAGISEGLIRVAVGIEATVDVVADFRQAIG